MFLVDTDVVSERRKGDKANAGVVAFFERARTQEHPIYLSAITIGELRRGVEIIRHRGDQTQADPLERWLTLVINEYADSILAFDAEVAQVWGRLRVPHPENPLDKQIGATALIHDLTLVTRNVKHFESFGVRLLNPFDATVPVTPPPATSDPAAG